MNTFPGKDADSRWPRIAFASLCLVFLLVLVRTAWLSDDAYITYRCVDNLVNGHGFGFNPAERVQAFTHPLWALLHVPLQAFSENIYYPAIGFSMLLSLATMFLIWKLPLPPTQKLILAAAMLFSKAYVDYSSSGLENPLNHLLALAFFWIWTKEGEARRKLFLLSFLAGLAVFNRMDMLLVFLPAILQQWWPIRSFKNMLLIVLAFLPFLLWEIFALLYYGFAFPNTAYAKLNSGIPKQELWLQGFRYLQDLLLHDPFSFLCIALGLIVVILGKKKANWGMGLGVLLYLLYTVNVGGDFMRGRFFTVPFLLALLLLADFSVSLQGKWRQVLWLPLLVGACFSVKATLLSGKDYGKDEGFRQSFKHGIADERAYYFGTTGLLNAAGEMPRHRWAEQGRNLKGMPPRVQVVTAVGMLGYYAGPAHHFVDLNALVDPLLARLPAYYNPEWRIGHFERLMPAGYYGTLLKQRPLIQDQGLQAYHSRLQKVVRAEIWSWDRFKEILRFALGKNEALLPKAHFRMPAKAALQVPAKEDSLHLSCNESICLALPPSKFPKGIRLKLQCHASAYSLVLRRGQEPIWGKLVEIKPEEIDAQPDLLLSFPQDLENVQPDNMVLFPHDCSGACKAWNLAWD